MILLTVFKYLLLSLAILLILILIVPFQYKLAGSKEEEYELVGYLSWLGGGIGVGFKANSQEGANFLLKILGSSWLLPYTPKKQRAAEQEESPKAKSASHVFKRYVIKRNFLEHAYIVLKQFLSYLKPQFLEAEGSIGFEDPYYTGLFCTVWYPVTALFQQANLAIKPIFEEACLNGSFRIEGKFVLGVISLFLLKLLRPLPLLKIMKELKEEKSYVIKA